MQNSIREDQLQSEIMNIPTMINYYIRSDLSLLIDNLNYEIGRASCRERV